MEKQLKKLDQNHCKQRQKTKTGKTLLQKWTNLSTLKFSQFDKKDQWALEK